jgi:Mitochondrial carrier protein
MLISYMYTILIFCTYILQVVVPGEPAKYTGLFQAMGVIAKEEGILALWKGLTPRLLRISKYNIYCICWLVFNVHYNTHSTKYIML